MKDIYELIKFSLVHRDAWSGNYVLAMVVHTEGHAYRRVGARLLLKKGRKIFGAVSGGCLEENIAVDSDRMNSECHAKRVDYDSRSASDLIWGTATGCGGLVSVLLQRWDSRINNLCAWVNDRLSARQPVMLATVINKDDQQLGRQIAIDTSGEIFSQVDSLPIQAAVMSRTADLLSESIGKPNRYQHRTCVAGHAELLLEYIPPPTSLVIIGAGDDARPVVECAKRLGWDVTVIDHRPAYADRQRLPLADQVVLTQPDSYSDLLHPDPWTVAIVMTHNWRQDAAAVTALAQFDLPYVGIIGNTKRTERILATMAARAGSRAKTKASFYYPAGLDIGAHNPEEIALSVIAEIRAVLSGRQGASLMLQERASSRSIDARLLAHAGADR
jgi:xanthine/CO dehydrogenase XdhC/CoxF family maturation factor